MIKLLTILSKFTFLGAFLLYGLVPEIAVNDDNAKGLESLENELSEPCFTENRTFRDGEEVTYIVYYQWGFIWLDAGEVTFKVEDEGDQYHFSVVGETYANYDWFFKVRDYYDTWVDKATLLPDISIRDVREGGYTLYDKITFDKEANTAYSERGRAIDRIKERNTFEIESCMHDMLSIVYWSRNLDFENYGENETFPIKIFVDKETWPLQVQYVGQESNKKIRGWGSFDTRVFVPDLIEGNVFPGDAKMRVWVTDDQNQLPLLIESPVSVGSVKAVLKEAKGLRYPLVSRKKK